MQLQQIFIYPIKSTRAFSLQQNFVRFQGLAFDRQFMLSEPDGTFITARKDYELFKFSAFPLPFGLFVKHQDGSQIQINYQDFSEQQNCEVWGSEFNSLVAPEQINRWFSEKLQRPVQFRYLGSNSQRRIKRFPDNPVSFADGYPLLLCSEQTLAAVQQACPAPIKMAQFRPSIVVDGIEPFVEQNWHKIRIGELEFINGKPSIRCTLIARDPDTLIENPKLEPFRTLKKVHKNEEGKPLFGINLVPLNEGVIQVGDQVEVLEWK